MDEKHKGPDALITGHCYLGIVGSLVDQHVL